MTWPCAPWPCDLLIMSVARLSDGVCVAALTEDNQWVRPTREEPSDWRQLKIADLQDSRQRFVVQVGNLVRWPLGQHMPTDVHTEDYSVADQPPVFIRRLDSAEFLRRCAQVASSHLADFLCSPDRSLALVPPFRVDSLVFQAGGEGGLSAHIGFLHGPHRYFSVKDLAWRALGRRLLTEAGDAEVVLSSYEFSRRERKTIRYLVIGRAREYRGQFWPLIVTVVTDPLNDEPLDYTRT